MILDLIHRVKGLKFTRKCTDPTAIGRAARAAGTSASTLCYAKMGPATGFVHNLE